MSMTLILQTNDEGEIATDDYDLVLIYEYTEPLDAACDRLGITRISEFLDTSENMNERFHGEEDEDHDSENRHHDDDVDSYEPDSDNTLWHDAHAGVESLMVLVDFVDTGNPLGLDGDEQNELVAELTHCVELLEPLAGRQAQFHFAQSL